MTDVTGYWRDDLVSFLIGCSFTFEDALREAGVPVRHIEQNRNVPMYRTNRMCRRAASSAARSSCRCGRSPPRRSRTPCG